jgi:hypothetical protein
VSVFHARLACAARQQRWLGGGFAGAAATGRIGSQHRLLSAQISAATLLLILATLAVRAVWSVSLFDTGFDRKRTALGRLNMAFQGFDEAQGQLAYSRALTAAGAASGVTLRPRSAPASPGNATAASPD